MKKALHKIEVWMPVWGAEGKYEVSSLGRVYSVPRKIISDRYKNKFTGGVFLVTSSLNSDGYAIVSICGKTKRIHRLVAEAFYGPDMGECVRHLNGNKLDNRVENLSWGTYKQNSQDSIDHGTVARGQKNAFVKLTEEQVVEIRKDYRRWENGHKDLAVKYGVCKGTIQHALTGRTWSYLDAPPVTPARRNGRCAKGHDLSNVGKISSKGHLLCNRCNSDAAKRYHAKKKKMIDEMRKLEKELSNG